MTAATIASSKTWQVSVVGWPVGGDERVVGGVMAVGLGMGAVDGVVDGEEVGGGGRC